MPSMPVHRVSVLLREGHTDLIIIYPGLPTTFPTMAYETHATIEAQQGTGVAWVRDNLKVEPRIIHG